ncbi:MAG: hypothetical protein ACJ8GN_27520 [Longimicrobiaceae bacterium]
MRIVKEKVIPAGVGRFRSGEGKAADVKEYFDRVAKYVPAEVIAAYISASGVATAASNPRTLAYLTFFVCLICTPLYITRFTETRKEAWTNGGMATIAFVVWAYATGGGLFQYLDWYDPPTASVILVLFTLVSGLAAPITKQPPPMPELVREPPPPAERHEV